MKFNISFEGDYYENRDVLESMAKASDYKFAVMDARAIIRKHLKHSDLDEKMSAILYEIKESLLVDEE